MIAVGNRDGQKVVEDGRGLWKADAVPTLVNNRLLRIPFKAQGHGSPANSGMRVQRASSSSLPTAVAPVNVHSFRRLVLGSPPRPLGAEESGSVILPPTRWARHASISTTSSKTSAMRIPARPKKRS